MTPLRPTSLPPVLPRAPRWPAGLGLSAWLALLASLSLLPLQTASAQTPVYQQPSPAIRAVLDAPGLPQAQLSPDQGTLARVGLRRHPTIAELARPMLGLAGRRFDPASSGPHRVTEIESLSLQTLAPGADGSAGRAVALPAGGGFHSLRWAPDGQRFLLMRRTDSATELWVGDTASAALRRVPGVRLNAVLSEDMAWLGPVEVVVLAVPDARGPAPESAPPAGPAVQESMGRTSPARTQQDLLQSAQDERLFAHHASAVLRRVRLDTLATREIGEPGLYLDVQAAGNAGLLMVERLLPPFSYQVGYADFGRQVSLLDAEGRVQADLGRVALRQGVPVGGVIIGPRAYRASPLADAAVYWVEALDGGNPQTPAAQRDRLLRLDPPYTGPVREVYRSTGRLAALTFLQTPGLATATDVDRDRLWLAVDLLALDGSAAPRRLQSRSMRDRYGDPGQPLTHTLANGRSVLRVDRAGAGTDPGVLWLVGDGASAQGERPFLDRLDLANGRSERRFLSPEGSYERPVTVLADGQLLTRRETASEPPNLWLRSGDDLARVQALTAHADPAPQLRALQRRLVKFKRADGVELSFWHVLPPGLKPGERRPTLVWAYPLEFTDAATAGQVSGSPHRFVSVGPTNPLLLALDGYVVLMDATMPVVGDPKTVNDSFVEQITANAQAIVEQAVALGASDARRMVVGGHSYGAFMTANLLAHTDLFAAGIARSGAYNRTLTPFGFQSERRSYWQAQDVYLKLSPFNYAQQLKEPLLLMHGEVDDNPGTFPIQSQRFYQALAGTGGNVRYVTLPHESHGYVARESVGHTLREMSDWVARHTSVQTSSLSGDR
jgi:dipeptidyl aminopeptidase/acylaminoacyl peptidase